MLALVVIFFLWVMPMIAAAAICEEKHRNIKKGLFLAFFLGWFAVAGLWLCLKTRNPKTGKLY
jgi:hypothetical protein